MKLQIPCQRSAVSKFRFDFQEFSHSAGAKLPLTMDSGAPAAADVQTQKIRAITALRT
jgi:hypothetical protein